MTRTSEPLIALNSMTEFKFVVTHRWVPPTAMVEGEAIPAKAQHLMTRATDPFEALSSMTELAFQFVIHTWEPLAVSPFWPNTSALGLMTRTSEPFEALSSVILSPGTLFITHTCEPLTAMSIGMLNLSALALMTRSTEPLLALISMIEFKFATHTLVPLAVMENSGAGSMTCN